MRGLMGIVLSSALFFSGCGSMTVGGFQHIDMSSSRYKGVIEKKADSLASLPDRTDGDTMAAIELYGSLGDESALKKMDKVAEEYFERDPRSGLIILMQCDKVHDIYSEKHK